MVAAVWTALGATVEKVLVKAFGTSYSRFARVIVISEDRDK